MRLQWELEDNVETGVFLFSIERSGSPGGPWVEVASNLADSYFFDDHFSDDNEVNLFSLARDIYYRVWCTPPSGPANKVVSPIVNVDGLSELEYTDPVAGIGEKVVPLGQFEPDPQTGAAKYPSSSSRRRRLLRRKVMRDMYVALKHLNGMEYYLLKRRHFGERCEVCYDTTTRTVLKSHCTNCHGTSWKNGYFTAVSMLGRQLPNRIRSKITRKAKDDINFTQIQLLAFPRIDEGDILVEKFLNRRWLIKHTDKTTLKTAAIHQTVTVSELPRSAPEYVVGVAL